MPVKTWKLVVQIQSNFLCVGLEVRKVWRKKILDRWIWTSALIMMFGWKMSLLKHYSQS